nr:MULTISPECIES: transposase [unclassified Streptomyces]
MIWDNVRLHLTADMWEFVGANAEWLTVFQLPAYAPDLNPTKGIGCWSSVISEIWPPRTSANHQSREAQTPGLRTARSTGHRSC